MKLALIEWVDSARPLSEWRFISDAPDMEVVSCMSVGWIVSETKQVLMLAPNLGDKNSENPQACGFMRIPKQAIIKRSLLVEDV